MQTSALPHSSPGEDSFQANFRSPARLLPTSCPSAWRRWRTSVSAICSRPARRGGEALLRFRNGPDTHKRLAAVVAAESECCSFLAMELRDTAEMVELSIRAPDGAEPGLDDIVAAFAGAERSA
jgi:hypothetical protein